MMMINRIRANTLIPRRLDADYYAPVVIANHDHLIAFGSIELRHAIDTKRSGYGTLPPSPEYLTNGDGIQLIRGGDLSRGSIRRPEVKVPTSYASRAAVARRGDVLLLIKGACIDEPDGVGLVSPDIEGFIFNGSCYRLTPSSADAGFLTAFFLTSYFLLQKRREIANTGISYNAEESVLSYLVPEVSGPAQKYIGDKVRQAERLRAKAELLQSQIDQVLMLEPVHMAMETPNDRTNRVHSRQLEPRLDAKFYSPRSMRIFEAVLACEGVRLRDLNAEISNGFEHRSFVEQGRAYVTVTQVGSRRLDLADVPRIPESVPVPERARLTERTVLAVRSGATIGTVVKAQAEDCHACVSSHFIILRFPTESMAAAIATFLNSRVGRSLQDKIVYGGVIPQISQDDLLSLPIPKAVLDAAEQLASWENGRELALRCAQRLVTSANILVESLIEGRLSESDLGDAQLALERGDQTLDRAILSRLTEEGIDVANQLRLFSDLDALYAVIDETCHIDSRIGDAV
jgi:type I restriction enzyme S subunit